MRGQESTGDPRRGQKLPGEPRKGRESQRGRPSETGENSSMYVCLPPGEEESCHLPNLVSSHARAVLDASKKANMSMRRAMRSSGRDRIRVRKICARKYESQARQMHNKKFWM